MRVALATCAQLPLWEVDDRPLRPSFLSQGINCQEVVWNAPGVDWSVFDAVLIRTVWDYANQWQSFQRWVARVSQVSRLLNPAPVVLWNLEKTYLRDLSRCGAPVAPTLWFDSSDSVDFLSLLRQHGWQRGFVKPVVGASSLHTLRFDATAAGLLQVRQHLAALAPKTRMMLQPYLASVETMGELSAIMFDGQFSHAVQKLPQPGDHRVQDDYGATDHLFDWQPEQQAALVKVYQAMQQHLSTLGIKQPLAYARIDLLKDMNHNWVLNELEVIEPSLFFRHQPAAASRLVAAVQRHIT